MVEVEGGGGRLLGALGGRKTGVDIAVAGFVVADNVNVFVGLA